MQLAPGRAIVFAAEVTRHDAGVGNAAPVRADGNLADLAQARDLLQAHAIGMERGNASKNQ
jgi:hypothetical protein